MKKILDHGYIELVETWGSDERIIEAARMSVDKGFLKWGPRHSDKCLSRTMTASSGRADVPPQYGECDCEPKPGDEKLLRYLWENKHTTPFEMAGAIIEVQAPIFVFREWHRHRTQSYNELSARYTPLPNTNYVPTLDRLLGGASGQTGHPQNKQAGTVKGANVLTATFAGTWCTELNRLYEQAEALYQLGLKNGIPKELARCPVPVARYSRMRASAVLLNWLKFIGLRSDMNPGAQWEIRQYANVLAEILSEVFPRTLALFKGER